MCKQRKGAEGGTIIEGGTSVKPKCGGNCTECPFQQKVIEEVTDVLGGNNSVNILPLMINNPGNKSL